MEEEEREWMGGDFPRRPEYGIEASRYYALAHNYMRFVARSKENGRKKELRKRGCQIIKEIEIGPLPQPEDCFWLQRK